MPIKYIQGNVADVKNGIIYAATIEVIEGKISNITRDGGVYDNFIIPGFIDAHIHIESSLLTPAEFARLAVVHGTVATVSDPHEIANVLGLAGIDYMVDSGRSVGFKFFFGAPSCVPATTFETSGATIGVDDIEQLLRAEHIKYLSEMMNYPGVLDDNPVVLYKISLARKYGKVVDGHAPGLRGEDCQRYIRAGISTDHECTTLEGAINKLRLGMKIIIREGSSARDLDTLAPLLKDHYADIMLCSDDKHPDGLVAGHINAMVKRLFKAGYDKMSVLRAACVNPVLHYGLDVGLLQEGDAADFLVVDNLDDLNVLQTVINGEVVAKGGISMLPHSAGRVVNNFTTGKKEPRDFFFAHRMGRLKVIEAFDGQLLTEVFYGEARVSEAEGVGGNVVSDVDSDILKLAVVNRYSEAAVSVGFVKGFGLRRGGMASSVAHDSHNIVAVGVSDEAICQVVNLVIEHKGGLAVVDDSGSAVLPLPIGGLMSDQDGFEVATAYARIDALAKELGSPLRAPFMTLSFMSLLVMPRLKLGDKGLFDVDSFEFTDAYVV
ncbi:adenine deaminase [Candidatus Magnetobacterium bavaricum]|uniref:Adenine deaminase n=1 Tax=Candidatus Magnetobacterium bavaricum TaxID=29290 RepID=A0A0F3GTP6_9BACT|nr:adenine deaminase [Candidatus Magnetobacterium bavaricum]